MALGARDPRGLRRRSSGGASPPRSLGVGGGAKRLVGWHDTQLGLDCRFENYVGKREHRCIPHVAQVSGGYLFADAACTEPLATIWIDAGTEEACATPQYAIELPAEAFAEVTVQVE